MIASVAAVSAGVVAGFLVVGFATIMGWLDDDDPQRIQTLNSETGSGTVTFCKDWARIQVPAEITASPLEYGGTTTAIINPDPRIRENR
jgi:hypothetical protein